MYPKLTVYTVKKASTLRDYIATLGGDLLYTYDKRLVGVIVNGEPKWPSAQLKPGDTVTVFPIMTGG
jgi:molybdopterin converting factor small subunit